jgi:hypothetical protein
MIVAAILLLASIALMLDGFAIAFACEDRTLDQT